METIENLRLRGALRAARTERAIARAERDAARAECEKLGEELNAGGS